MYRNSNNNNNNNNHQMVDNSNNGQNNHNQSHIVNRGGLSLPFVSPLNDEAPIKREPDPTHLASDRDITPSLDNLAHSGRPRDFIRGWFVPIYRDQSISDQTELNKTANIANYICPHSPCRMILGNKVETLRNHVIRCQFFPLSHKSMFMYIC